MLLIRSRMGSLSLWRRTAMVLLFDLHLRVQSVLPISVVLRNKAKTYTVYLLSLKALCLDECRGDHNRYLVRRTGQPGAGGSR